MKGLVVPTIARDGPHGQVGPSRELPGYQPSRETHIDQPSIGYRDSVWVSGHATTSPDGRATATDFGRGPPVHTMGPAGGWIRRPRPLRGTPTRCVTAKPSLPRVRRAGNPAVC